MKNFNSIFVFAHTIKQFNKLLDCIDEMPNNDMETLKLSFVGDEVRRIIIDVAFMSSIYKGFGESVVGFEFLKEVVTSKKFFENIQLLENKVKNIEEELQPQFSMLKEAFTSLYENHSALNKKLYGAVV